MDEMLNTKSEYKQAFLIMAHKNDESFLTLIKMLDKPWNDIYIHMDKKNKEYCSSEVVNSVKSANVFHTRRTDVTWGGYSQIKAELILLKEATYREKYNYYHMLSGQDLPIQEQERIRDFFRENFGKEFVRFENEKYKYKERSAYFYILQELCGRNRGAAYHANKLLVSLQKRMHFERNKKIEFQKGTNWFSITDNLARYVLQEERWIKKTFKHTLCCDEVFLQTLIHNSEFKRNLYNTEYNNDERAIARHIDWNRGNPYIFTVDDFEELKNSEMMFARKFDASIDCEIISKIEREYSH